MPTGVLPSQDLRQLILAGGIRAETPICDAQVQPASLDLRLSSKAWRLRASFLPGKSGMGARLSSMCMHEMDLSAGAVLEKGCVYLIPLMEKLALPPGIAGIANAKSSTGRLDLLTRVITEDGTAFDRIPDGYHGNLYAEICPLSFSVLVRPGLCLTQMRLCEGSERLEDQDLRVLHERTPLVDGEPLISDGLGFSVDLSGDETGLVGYRAKPHSGVVDLTRIGVYPVADFWEPVCSHDQSIILDPGAFYILMSRESVRIPPGFAAEMAPYLAVAGEFRVHYAGFFDPGFGCPETGGAGARGVLEVRCHDAPFLLEHAQMVGCLVFERMKAVPDRLYGAGIASNYQGQKLKLAKQFSQ